MNSKFINQMEPLLGKEEEHAVVSYLRSGGWLTEFKETEKLEQMIADYVGVKYVCMVNNGSSSLLCALLALGIGSGDEVIVPNLTMIVSANAIFFAGATPKLVDIEPKSLCLDLSLVEKTITNKTKAIMTVSLNGRSQDMNKLILFCKKNNLFLIEDAAQSLGSKWQGKHLGTFGDIGSFSFSMPKIITTGQGGALVSNNRKLMDKVRMIKDFGRIKSGVDVHELLGFNFKFTDLQASIGIEQMKKLKLRVKRKKEIYSLYQKKLSGIQGIRLIETDLSQTTPWMIDVLVIRREELIAYLKQHGIGSRPFYPAIHTQAPYKDLKEYKNAKLNESIQISKSGLWLPSSLTLSNKQIDYISCTIREFYKND